MSPFGLSNLVMKDLESAKDPMIFSFKGFPTTSPINKRIKSTIAIDYTRLLMPTSIIVMSFLDLISFRELSVITRNGDHGNVQSCTRMAIYLRT